MTQNIVNGAGMTINLGTDDLSKKVVPVTPEQIPQHLPMCFLFAQKGTEKSLVDGVSAQQIFGAGTFDPRGPYYNHVTAFTQKAIANGNNVMIKRLIPTDAGPKANLILSLDVLPTTVNRYQRLTDGSIALDDFGDPTVIDTTLGLKVKFVQTHRTTVQDQEDFGSKTVAQGDQVDGSVHSQRYPIIEVENSYYGGDGNNTGFRLWAPNSLGGNSMPTALMQKYNAYPYLFSVVERADASSPVTLDKAVTGETQVMFTFKSGVVDPTTAQQLSWDQRLIQAYNLIDVPGYPNIRGRIGKVFVYEDNVETVLGLMYANENAYITNKSDITEDPASAGLLNFVTGTSSSGVPYESYQFVDSVTSVRLSASSNVFLTGGSDGTMDNDMFETLIGLEMDKYSDATDEVQDLAVNVESVIYDSGFSLNTKFKLAQFISIRKDTWGVFGTHTVGQPANTESQEQSIAIALRTRLQMYPESDYFGTPVCRAMIMGRSGLIRNSEYTEIVPCTYELMDKFSKYMGAGNGAWKSGSSPEGGPGNLVTQMKSINITYVPPIVRNLNWDTGLNWILAFDRSRLFIPAYKTVYNDDTSVLNSIIVCAGIATLNKAANYAWRVLTGRTDLTPAQLCERTNAIIRDYVSGIFDNRFTVIPAATLTNLDGLRGYSWSLPIKIGANNMTTVMTTWVEAYRQADLTSNSQGG